MNKVNKWIRKIHRWLVMPFIAAVIILIVITIRQGENFTSPVWLGVVGIGSLLSMAVTGIYMFAQHYLAKWQRAARLKRDVKSDAANAET
jgi:hypothetical protein